jgi:hypothetical protein
MPDPMSSRTPAPAPARGRPSTVLMAGYVATVSVLALGALVLTLALTSSWVWAILACAVAGRATVIALRLAGVSNPLPWGRNRRG